MFKVIDINAGDLFLGNLLMIVNAFSILFSNFCG